MLTQDQIDLLNLDQTQAALEQLAKDYRLDTPLSLLTSEEWALVDLVANQLIALENRIKWLLNPEAVERGPQIVVPSSSRPLTPSISEVNKTKTGPKARRFRIGNEIFKDIHEASAIKGVKVDSLRCYVGRKPDVYGYLD